MKNYNSNAAVVFLVFVWILFLFLWGSSIYRSMNGINPPDILRYKNTEDINGNL